jgi:transglutaminase-like putative cysteine protease
MTYEIQHRTTYDYDTDVSLSHHVAYLTPRATNTQRCVDHQLGCTPSLTTHAAHADHFGNLSSFLTVEGSHRRLEIVATSRVDVSAPCTPAPDATPPWENIRDLCSGDSLNPPIEAVEFIFGSPLAPCRADLAQYAQPSFPAGRPILAAALDLCGRIHIDFTFDTQATTVMTTVQDFFRMRRGVCQDFAHVMAACLRSIGLPARYVSGYLETLPPPGKPKLIGSDASHAWISIWCGEHGWVDLDPTNNVVPSGRHITTAFGRDYGDVTPLRGILVGGGSHKLTVSVDVKHIE